ncbi:uncharacterized protein BO95DRAFT_221568 [Aspergillus brunneoviolaceus CBS 621.78]|uniref:Uncharacterized protein n=1 Tax=Aspergillus brunneoviolaceus CBS 621.78 TaxID=1450534 RepID=A0ACD1GLT9_9EURO|nr:hypothetical protein BO95DRAFT_221568 [Aspergillus brunneoviolaceus CBS 621.78]RAH50103.1 hypothetical protein BO95DRAFT_221568 [Aspergillus brunneoviolaceus CBS 621.78]
MRDAMTEVYSLVVVAVTLNPYPVCGASYSTVRSTPDDLPCSAARTGPRHSMVSLLIFPRVALSYPVNSCDREGFISWLADK